MKHYHSLLLLVTILVGCKLTATLPHHDYSNVIAITAGEKASTASDPTVNPPTPVSTRHLRKDCPNNGVITHGDGHTTPCPDCDPPYADVPPMPPVEEESHGVLVTPMENLLASAKEPTKAAKCQCDNCQCDKTEVLSVRNYPNGRYLKVNLDGNETWLWEFKPQPKSVVKPTPKKAFNNVPPPYRYPTIFEALPQQSKTCTGPGCGQSRPRLRMFR